MSIIYPVESNTPLKPAPAWPNLTTAATQLGGDEISPFTLSGELIPPGTTATKSANVFTDVSFEASLSIVIDVTAFTSGTLTVSLQGKTSSGTLYPILTSAALAATGVTVLRVAQGLTAVSNLTANDMLPNEMVVTCTVSGTLTYGIDVVIG
jgi:hypothetical protein